MAGHSIARGGLLAGLAVLVGGFVVHRTTMPRDVESVSLSTASSSVAAPASDGRADFIYGRITTIDDATYEGRLRWGGDQEGFWGDYFNGAKAGNPWAAYAAPPPKPSPIEIFGLTIGGRDDGASLRRSFMARFGDIAHIDALFRDVQVRLKSGTVIALDRFAAGDIDDGVRVWDGKRGIVDIDSRQIRSIDFVDAPGVTAPGRLHGTVRTRQGNFTGFIQWDQRGSVGTDELRGRSADGEESVRYDTIRSIARHSRDTALVTRLDGREMVLSGTGAVGDNNRGIYVDDVRYGRVLVSWNAFDRIDFSPGGSGWGYAEYSPGRSLNGSITTRDGRRLSGRLVYDFDESETTETLDAALPGIDYNIPFSLIASIVPNGPDGRGAPYATVTLTSGEELQLERSGDLSERNAGVLVFAGESAHPTNVPWADVAQIQFVAPTQDQSKRPSR